MNGIKSNRSYSSPPKRKKKTSCISSFQEIVQFPRSVGTPASDLPTSLVSSPLNQCSACLELKNPLHPCLLGRPSRGPPFHSPYLLTHHNSTIPLHPDLTPTLECLLHLHLQFLPRCSHHVLLHLPIPTITRRQLYALCSPCITIRRRKNYSLVHAPKRKAHGVVDKRTFAYL